MGNVPALREYKIEGLNLPDWQSSEGGLTAVAHEQEVMVDSLGEAIVKAKALTNSRIETAKEGKVILLDKSRPAQQLVWERSAAAIRAG